MKKSLGRRIFSILAIKEEQDGDQLLIIDAHLKEISVPIGTVTWNVTEGDQKNDDQYRYCRATITPAAKEDDLDECRITGPRYMLEKLLSGLGYVVAPPGANR